MQSIAVRQWPGSKFSGHYFHIFLMNSGISVFPTTNVCQLTSYQRQTVTLIAFVQKMQKDIKMLSTSMSTSQLGLNEVCVILSHRHDSITSVWYFVLQCITSSWYYHRDVILHKFQLFQIWKKLRNFFCSKINLKWKFGTYTPCVARI